MRFIYSRSKKIVIMMMTCLLLLMPMSNSGVLAEEDPDVTPPSVPTGLAASNISETGFKLTWNASIDDVGVAAYDVYLDGVLFDTALIEEYEFTGLDAYTTYSLTVLAKDAADNSSTLSSALSVKTLDSTAPTAPTNLSASNIAATSFQLDWTASTDAASGVKKYDIFRNGSKIASVNAPTTTYNVTGLTMSTSYTMTVVAFDNETPSNESDASAALEVETIAAVDTAPPTAPSGLKFLGLGITTINIEWTASTDDTGIDEYIVYVNGISVGTTASTSYTVTSLNPNTTYSISVKAKDLAANLSAASNVIDPKTLPDTIKPTVPGSFASNSVTDTAAAFSWTASTDNVAVKDYVITRFNSKNMKEKDYVVDDEILTLNVTDLTKDTKYNFRIQARDTSDVLSNFSSIVTFTTGNAPTPPTTFSTKNVAYSSFTLEWSGATDDTAVKGYHVYLNGTKITTSLISQSMLEVIGLTHDTSYSMTVQAVDAAGNTSAQSTPHLVSTLEYTGAALAPKDTYISNVTDTSLVITYNPHNGLLSAPVPHFRQVGESGPIGEFEPIDAGQLTNGNKTITVSGLTAGTKYQFKLVSGEGPILTASTRASCGGACPGANLGKDPALSMLVSKMSKTSAVIKYRLLADASVSVKLYSQAGGAPVVTALNNVSKKAGIQTQTVPFALTLTEGVYQLTVSALSTAPGSVTEEIHQTLVVDRTNPVISSFTAGNIDATAETPTTSSTISFQSSELTSAIVSIFSANGKTVVRNYKIHDDVIAGQAKQVVWDGKDSKGAAVADNNYVVKVTATDSIGNKVTSSAVNIFVERNSPTLTQVTPVAPPENPFSLDTKSAGKSVAISFKTSELSQYKVEILDDEESVVKTLTLATTMDVTLEPEGVKKVSWNGTGADNKTKVADGTYSYKITMIDRIGTQVTSVGTIVADSVLPSIALAGGQNPTVTGSIGGSVTVNYTISEAILITAVVKQGSKLVRTIEKSILKTGVSYPATIPVIWDGKQTSATGANAPAGSYSLELTAVDRSGLKSNKLTVSITLQ